MYTKKLHRPVAAMLTLAMVAAAAVVACGDDTSENASPGVDGGGGGPDTSTNPVPDSSTPDAGGDASASEYTVDVGLGYATGCALSNKGRVKCWGDAVDGTFLAQPVPGKSCWEHDDQAYKDCDPRGPTDLKIPYPVEQLSVGYETVCVIANDKGTKKLGCWGRNDQEGRLSSFAPDASDLVTSVVWIDLPSPPKKIASGHHFKVVLLEDGSLWGWGDNSYGHYAAATLEPLPTPSKVFPFSIDGGGVDAGSIVDMAPGRINTLLLTTQGLYGAGDNSHYQGQSETPDELHEWTLLPTARSYGDDAGAPDGGDPVAKLFRSHGRTEGLCYITVAGKAFCWSDNDYLQIGTPRAELVTTVITPELVDLPPERKATQIAIATGGICALTDNGTVYCWGDNSQGAAAQNPPQGNLVSPKLVPGLTDVTAIAVGTNYVACAVTGTSHKTFCWGANGYGQLGKVPPPDSGPQQSTTPVEVPITW